MKIFIGYDPQFEKNIQVQINSILKNTNEKIEFHLLIYNDLRKILYREKSPYQSTESAFTRWLVPYLSDYKGWSLYMDSDMYCRENIKHLFDCKDEQYSLMVVKNKILHEQSKKFNDKNQINYDRKNWSSLILFNNSKCRTLNLDYVNTETGLNLHQFKWLPNDQIGELDEDWNHLVGVNDRNTNAKIVHWTLGGPWFEGNEEIEFSKEWFKDSYQLENSQVQN